MVAFRKAERFQTYLKIALAGPSGSGKTFSALMLADGMAKKLDSRIAVIDTENRSASLYSDRVEFDVLEIEPPYTVMKYEQAVKAAMDAGYKVIVIDSISHQWAGEGGILDKKAKMDAAGGNSFTHWAKLTPDQERFRSMILHSKVHMICTMRSKQEYSLEVDDKGRTTVRKVGMAPVQREGMEYEFTTVFDIDMGHHAQASKDRTGLFDGIIEKLSPSTGEKLFAWLSGAKLEAPKAEAPKQDEAPPSSGPAKDPGIICTKCSKKVVLHRSGAGYACEDSTGRGDGHTRFMVAELPKYTNQAQAG